MIDQSRVYHVYPTGDLEEHHLECVYPLVGNPFCSCKCKPEYQQVDDSFIVVHNSFDGREGVEWVKEILNHNNNESA